jgi:hypothetical protein
MARTNGVNGLRHVASLAASVMAIVLVGGAGLRSAGAQTFTPQSDDWKGTTLDLTRWHVTLMGDAQTETSGVEVNSGTIKITAGGSDIWNDNDNGLFLWQPANGDFQVQIEVRTLKKISDSTKVGVMVRPNNDLHAPHIFMIAMPKGTHLQARTDVGVDAGPGSGDAGRLAWGDGSGNGPTMNLRLTRTGKKFESARSFDGGKTWERLHDADHPDTDVIELAMPDDVLMGIMVGAINADSGNTDSTDAVLGPFTFTQIATRPTTNGLVAVTAVTDKGELAADAFLVIKDKDGKEVGSTKNDVTDPATSNTGSFFLPPGTYTVEAGETDQFNAGVPVPFEIKTAQTQDLKVTVGKAK